MGKITARCPVCSGPVEESRGYYVCDRHGVMPYDWVMGTITRDKALDMMSKWGIECPRTARRGRSAPRATAPEEAPRTSAPSAGVEGLLNRLRVETNPVEKRKLRAALRAAGHKGGLHG